MKSIDEHFSELAVNYNEIRTTDTQPIEYIKTSLFNYESCVALDVGCGPGRYSLLLLQMMPQLHLTCLDKNNNMLAETTRLLRDANMSRFRCVPADASELPLESKSVDVVFTFNAIHHFTIPAFLREAQRVLKKDGTIVIYTRLPSQNAASIWGKYFPDFITLERRLQSLDSMEAAIRNIPGLTLDSIKLFQFDRVSSLECLIEKARASHYSTFNLYEKKHLESSIAKFRDRIMSNFSDLNRIRWTDGNVLLIAKPCDPGATSIFESHSTTKKK
jgi:ubiquinone/menaquinone biosynthesis C-methylase UbiE